LYFVCDLSRVFMVSLSNHSGLKFGILKIFIENWHLKVEDFYPCIVIFHFDIYILNYEIIQHPFP